MNYRTRPPRCEHLELELGPVKGPHAASFRCARCGSFRGWCSKHLYSDLKQDALTERWKPLRIASASLQLSSRGAEWDLSPRVL